MGQRDARASLRERDRGLGRGIPSPDHEHLPPRVVVRVVESVEHLVALLAWHLELAEASALPDRDDHVPRVDRLAALEMYTQTVAHPLDSRRVRARRADPGRIRLCAQLVEQGF